MEKRIDFWITKVKYNQDRQFIEKVEIHAHRGTIMGPAELKKRLEVISGIKAGHIYYTAPVDKNTGKLIIGMNVDIVNVDGREFIRTDKNQKTMDNLGELPEFV